MKANQRMTQHLQREDSSTNARYQIFNETRKKQQQQQQKNVSYYEFVYATLPLKSGSSAAQCNAFVDNMSM